MVDTAHKLIKILKIEKIADDEGTENENFKIHTLMNKNC
jgi:hypothetical protein